MEENGAEPERCDEASEADDGRGDNGDSGDRGDSGDVGVASGTGDGACAVGCVVGSGGAEACVKMPTWTGSSYSGSGRDGGCAGARWCSRYGWLWARCAARAKGAMADKSVRR